MAITWNPDDKGSNITLSNGNLTATSTSTGWKSVRATVGKLSGKWYWEIKIDVAATVFNAIGAATSSASLNLFVGGDSYGYGYYGYNGRKFHNNVGLVYGDSFGLNDIIGVALDLDNGKIWWAKNGEWQASGDPAAGTNEAYSGLSGTFFPMASLHPDTNQITARFALEDLTYSPPSGFAAFGAATEITSDLDSEIAADHLTNFLDLVTDISVAAVEIISDLNSEVRVGNELLTDLNIDAEAKAQALTNLLSEIHAKGCTFCDLNIMIEAIRSKWWLGTEIKAGCAARWNFNTEWNPGRFLSTAIEAKKPYAFSFKTQSAKGYAATESSVEFKIPGYPFPIRTLFLDYIAVDGVNEYPLQLWWARGLLGKGTLKNAKIKAEYIDTQYSGGYEVVTCNWISYKINDGEYKTINETPVLLGDIPCDSYLDLLLKVECRDCSLTRGLVFFKLNISGDYREAIYGDSIVYQDGSQYHAGEQDDYQSIDFICRLYVVE